MTLKSGWMEKRQFERIDATIRVSYTVISKEALAQLLSDPHYQESTAEHLPELAKKSNTVHAVTRDISVGGMSLVGETSFPPDSALEINIYLPSSPMPLTVIAEVVRAQSENSTSNGTIYRAGIKILAINRKDIMRLDKFLLTEKLRQHGSR